MKAIRPTPRFIKQTAEKTKKKAMRRALRRASEPIGMGEKAQHNTPFLELYQVENCPFSHAVRSHLSRIGLDYVVHNVSEQLPLKHEQLTQAGGKDQIPFLVDRKTGVKLYDSETIVSYLQKEYGQTASTRLGEWLQELTLRLKARRDEIAWALRAPYENARILGDELLLQWSEIKDSYRVIKNAIRAPRADRTASPTVDQSRKSTDRKAA